MFTPSKARKGVLFMQRYIRLLLSGSMAIRPPSREIGEGNRVEAAAIRWRLPLAFGSNLPALGDNPVWVAEQIGLASSGELRVEVFEPGELVPAFSIVDAVKAGQISQFFLCRHGFVCYC